MSQKPTIKEVVKEIVEFSRICDFYSEELDRHEAIISAIEESLKSIHLSRYNYEDNKQQYRNTFKAGAKFLRGVRKLVELPRIYLERMELSRIQRSHTFISHDINVTQANIPFKKASELSVQRLAKLWKYDVYTINACCHNLDDVLNELLYVRYQIFLQDYPLDKFNRDKAIKEFAAKEEMNTRSAKVRINKVLVLRLQHPAILTLLGIEYQIIICALIQHFRVTSEELSGFIGKAESSIQRSDRTWNPNDNEEIQAIIKAAYNASGQEPYQAKALVT